MLPWNWLEKRVIQVEYRLVMLIEVIFPKQCFRFSPEISNVAVISSWMPSRSWYLLIKCLMLPYYYFVVLENIILKTMAWNDTSLFFHSFENTKQKVSGRVEPLQGSKKGCTPPLFCSGGCCLSPDSNSAPSRHRLSDRGPLRLHENPPGAAQPVQEASTLPSGIYLWINGTLSLSSILS